MAGEKKRKSQPDWLLLVSALLLTAIGIIMVFSSSQYFAQYYPYYDTFYFLKRQLRNMLVGLVFMLLAYKLNYHFYHKLTYPVYLSVLGLLIFMAVSTSLVEVGGAERWMTLFGQTFQPSELAKIALPMIMAKWLSQHIKDVESFQQGFLPCIAVLGLTCGLIFLQNHLSSAMVIGMTGFIIMFCAGIRVRYLLGTVGLGVAGVTFAILLTDFRMERIYAWLDPWTFEQDGGWQVIQSLYAIGSGGLTGVGLGSGGSKWFYLPERHTDFIFSVLCEEMGFLGAAFVILLIVFIVWRGIMIAVKAPNTYASLLSMGLIASIAMQSLINLGVVTGLLPVTGVTLPFVSYGGTSLVVSLTMVGMLLNISRYIER